MALHSCCAPQKNGQDCGLTTNLSTPFVFPWPCDSNDDASLQELLEWSLDSDEMPMSTTRTTTNSSESVVSFSSNENDDKCKFIEPLCCSSSILNENAIETKDQEIDNQAIRGYKIICHSPDRSDTTTKPIITISGHLTHFQAYKQMQQQMPDLTNQLWFLPILTSSSDTVSDTWTNILNETCQKIGEQLLICPNLKCFDNKEEMIIWTHNTLINSLMLQVLQKYNDFNVDIERDVYGDVDEDANDDDDDDDESIQDEDDSEHANAMNGKKGGMNKSEKDTTKADECVNKEKQANIMAFSSFEAASHIWRSLYWYLHFHNDSLKKKCISHIYNFTTSSTNRHIHLVPDIDILLPLYSILYDIVNVTKQDFVKALADEFHLRNVKQWYPMVSDWMEKNWWSRKLQEREKKKHVG